MEKDTVIDWIRIKTKCSSCPSAFALLSHTPVKSIFRLVLKLQLEWWPLPLWPWDVFLTTIHKRSKLVGWPSQWSAYLASMKIWEWPKEHKVKDQVWWDMLVISMSGRWRQATSWGSWASHSVALKKGFTSWGTTLHDALWHMCAQVHAPMHTQRHICIHCSHTYISHKTNRINIKKNKYSISGNILCYLCKLLGN